MPTPILNLPTILNGVPPNQRARGVTFLTKWFTAPNERFTRALVVPHIAAIELRCDDDLAQSFEDSPGALFDAIQDACRRIHTRARYRLCRRIAEPFYIRRPNGH